MKVGIITITNGSNYGNRLQNYASQEVLKSLGVKPETIFNVTGQKVVEVKSYKEKIKKRLIKIYDKLGKINSEKLNELQRYIKFNEFNDNYIKKSKYIINKDNIPNDLDSSYDYFICGSDQIWNPNFYFNSEVDFLTFTSPNKRISYAASFGVDCIQEDYKKIYKKMLTEMKDISVREVAGAKIVKELTGRDASIVIDPTLMLDKNKWLSIVKDNKIRKKYILTYFLGNENSDISNTINKLAQHNEFDIINLLDKKNKFYGKDPSDFIKLINESEVFFTDSFHGVVFSLIMKTSFVICDRKDKNISMNSRIETLLDLFNMKNRRYSNVISNNSFFITNFNGVDEIIKNEKDKTIQYLRKSLNIINNQL